MQTEILRQLTGIHNCLHEMLKQTSGSPKHDSYVNGED